MDGSRLLYYTDRAEYVGGLVGLLTPGIDKIGRADVSDHAARLLGVTGPLGHRFPVAYVWEDEAFWYLPDYGCTRGRRPMLLEAGVSHAKGAPPELAKLRTAKELLEQSGGELAVVAADQVPPRWVRGALALHLARLDYRGDPRLLAEIRAVWEQERASIEALVTRFAPAYPPEVVVAAGRKVAGDLLAEGRLDVDLSHVVITFGTPIRARPRREGVLEPPGIVRNLSVLEAAHAAHGKAPTTLEETFGKPPIDPDSITDPKERDLFVRRCAARDLVDGGCTVAAAARANGLEVRRFQQCYARYLVLGERAFVPWVGQAPRRGGLREEMRGLIRELFMGSHRPTIAAIVEHRRVHRLAADLGMKRTPSRYQVSREVGRLLAEEQAVREARAGGKLVPLTVTGRAVATEFVPGAVCEFDEAWLDVTVVALAGTKVTVRLRIGVLIDVATRYILSVVVSPKALDQWDLRRAILRALLPSGELRRRYGIKREAPWAGMGPIPCLVKTDNGKIERSKLALQMAADVPFVLEFTPVRDPHAKAVVEALFKLLNETFLHRLVITTKSNPDAKGAHDPGAEAVARGIDADAFERALMQIVYDVYPIRWHGGLNERPEAVMKEALARFPVRTWMGTADELRRLLRRDEGTRKVDRHGISYKRYWYGADWLKERVNLGIRVGIKVDEDDLRTIDVYTLDGEFLGVAKSEKLAERFGRAVSRWELRLTTVADREFEKLANGEALARQHEIEAELEGDDKPVRESARKRHHSRRREETATATDLPVSESTPASRTAPSNPIPPSLHPAEPDVDTYEALDDFPAA